MDVDARERERERLMLHAMFDALEEAVILVDWPARRIVHVNRACERIFGYTAEELRGQSTEVFHVDHAHFVEYGQRIAERFREGKPATLEYRMRRRDGEVFPTEHDNRLLLAPDGAVLAGLTITRDVSARVRAQQELDQARKALAEQEKLAAMGGLVAGVAHEIRTPLAYILNNLAILERQLPPEAPQMRNVAQAMEGVERVNKLVADLRRFTQTRAEVRDADPTAVVAQALDLFRATHRGRIELRARLEPASARPVDRTRLQQVVLNLLENAAEAQGDGVIEVEAGPMGEDAWRLVVRDQGPGIAHDTQARMWDPFFTTKAEGTGLGLAIVRRIVAQHGGEIRCESDSGKGATFTVWLPRR